jgi:hypothetical protein
MRDGAQPSTFLHVTNALWVRPFTLPIFQCDRLLTRGSTTTTTLPLVTLPIADRFWRKVNRTPTCWLWLAGVQDKDKPYGQFWLTPPTVPKRRNYRAHRVSWWLTYGTWPADCLLHTCDNPACVRPDHLFEGTNLDNSEDKIRKGRQAHTLTEQQVRAIHAATATGEMYKSIGARFGTTTENVHYIATGQSWRRLGLRPIYRNARW